MDNQMEDSGHPMTRTPAVMEIELKPCPFCGGEALMHRVPWGWQVTCHDCGAAPRNNSNSNRETETEAGAAWNTRTPAEPLADGEMTMEAFQDRVSRWMDDCFTPTIKTDRLERCDRFVEEALELVQTEPTFTADRAHALVDYVFGRSVGEADQEVGGVLVTLAALCGPFWINMGEAGERELARINSPQTIEKIRAKQAAKPTGSALPITTYNPNDRLREALFNLTIAAGELAVATDGEVRLRPKRQAVLDAMKVAEVVLTPIS